MEPHRLDIMALAQCPLFILEAARRLLQKDPDILRGVALAISRLEEGVAAKNPDEVRDSEFSEAAETLKIAGELVRDIAAHIERVKKNRGFFECVRKLAAGDFPVVDGKMIVPPRILDAALAASSGNKAGKEYEGECHACAKFYKYTAEKIKVDAATEMSVKCPHCGVDDWIGKMPPPPPECFAPATGGTQ